MYITTDGLGSQSFNLNDLIAFNINISEYSIPYCFDKYGINKIVKAQSNEEFLQFLEEQVKRVISRLSNSYMNLALESIDTETGLIKIKNLSDDTEVDILYED